MNAEQLTKDDVELTQDDCKRTATPTGEKILTINGGSSSVKFALFSRGPTPRRLFHGSVSRIGSAEARLTVSQTPDGRALDRVVEARDIPSVVPWVLSAIDAVAEKVDIRGIGYRIDHGGERYVAPEVVSAAMIAALRELSPFDPDHLPGEISLIESIGSHFPTTPAVACFDTAFHAEMPRVAQLLPIPRKYSARGVRRFGFHGLSYSYLLEELARQAGEAAASGRVVLAHLGAGASMAAVKTGRCLDTTMGFTPAAGLVMGSRSGDIDPGLVAYLSRVEGMSPAQFDHLVNHESGLLGLSETSSDVRDLVERERGDTRAAEALDVFCYHAKRWLCAFAGVLGGLDTLVFAGGIGEHAPSIRDRICHGLEFLGIDIDADRNRANASLISTESGRVAVRVIPTDEEQMIARAVDRHLNAVTAPAAGTASNADSRRGPIERSP
jgi:acetate kinase